MMGRCATCKWWRYYRTDEIPDTEWGGCAKMNAGSEIAVADSDGQYGLQTHQTFGCVEHETGEPLPRDEDAA